MKVSVIGSGTMGSGIAQVAADAGHTVVLYDADANALVMARESLVAVMNRLIEKGRKSREEADSLLGRIQYAESIEAVEGSGLVIEAIVEVDHNIPERIGRELNSLLVERQAV